MSLDRRLDHHDTDAALAGGSGHAREQAAADRAHHGVRAQHTSPSPSCGVRLTDWQCATVSPW
ncbi:hypothetical protein ACIQF6_28230 [Kitasatospora sp. NPDC092948]|uniref:hypothetical protein n=1 Tax=Kitasatospora sp. NPDC092948 TaxID=3364088 RepID=UPI003802C72D